MSSKCVKMHVGRPRSSCPNLKVHDNLMNDVTEISYLGDTVTADGRNVKNIRERTKKGTILVFQVKEILETIKLGTYTPEIAVLLRNTVLINGMMTNAEIWYNLTNTQVIGFEKVDLLLFQKKGKKG